MFQGSQGYTKKSCLKKNKLNNKYRDDKVYGWKDTLDISQQLFKVSEITGSFTEVDCVISEEEQRERQDHCVERSLGFIFKF